MILTIIILIRVRKSIYRENNSVFYPHSTYTPIHHSHSSVRAHYNKSNNNLETNNNNNNKRERGTQLTTTTNSI